MSKATTYTDFLDGKRVDALPVGFDATPADLHAGLFAWQAAIVTWALRRGRAALFEDTGLGKALSVDTLVLTPTGYRRMGGMCVGDQVIGSDGRPTTVTGVYPQGMRPAYRVAFSDGASTVCDIEHLWPVRSKVQRYRGWDFQPRTLKEIMEVGLHEQEGWRHFIPMVQPIEFAECDVPLDPYLLGVLIGDGGLSRNTPMVSSIDDSILKRVADALHGGAQLVHANRCTWSITTGGHNGHQANPVTAVLRELGLMGARAEHKFIPDAYKFASRQSREALLQGLLDTDGYVSTDNHIEFTTVSRSLAQDTAFLVQSLGGTGRIHEKETGYQLAYRVSVALPAGVVPFALERKAAIYHPREKYQPTRAIVAVEPAGEAEMVCIAVDAPDHCYVIEHCIVTHNTRQQLVWAHHVYAHTGRDVLILAPLAVAEQTQEEGVRIGLTVTVCRTQDDVQPGLNITNYEMLRHFTPDAFTGIVLDEASILKSYDGKTRAALNAFARPIPYRLVATATPAPNDIQEIVNYADFLDVMAPKEVLALFFTQDGNTTHQWRLKGHAKTDFWRWLASWAVALRKPSDIGYRDDDYRLPPLSIEQHTVAGARLAGHLFAVEAKSMSERLQARRESIADRVALCAQMVNTSTESWVVWCNLNAESAALAKAIPDAVEVAGSDSAEQKRQAMIDFAAGRVRVLISKPTICGFGMNWQHCHHVAFVGLSDSYEQTYQATRRCWRFGQQHPVTAHYITAETEGAVVANIQRKERHAAEMMDRLVTAVTAHTLLAPATAATREEMAYSESVVSGRDWTLFQGDSVLLLDGIADESVGLSIFSPPFPGMYAYTNSPHDMGNTKSQEEMLAHFRFLVGKGKLWRATMPGRMCCVHLTQTPVFKHLDGYVGLRDFRGDVIRLMSDEGWIYYGEVTIDKDPQVKAQRTKERGLMFKTLATDSSLMRMALADYLLYFMKPGQNPHPIRAGRSVKHGNPDGWITNDEWIEWAHPVWYGVRETRVLNVRTARESDDERHLCPLQLDVIERAVKLWSAPGDLICDPFAGVGSTGVTALELGRRFVGIELKGSYFATATRNLRDAAARAGAATLWDGASEREGPS